MKSSGTAGLGAAALVALLITAALIALFYLGWQAAGLPFVPFDLFDWTTRVLPGPVIRFGIGTMVTVIGALHLGPTAATAKLAEQTMAIAGLLFTGLITGMILFGILRAWHSRSALLLGLGLGVILGLPIMFLSLRASQTASVAPALSAVWVLGMFLLWGATLGRAEGHLAGTPGTETAAGQTGPGDEAAAVERIDRRRFLIRLGGSTAAITVVGAAVGKLAEAQHQRVAVGATNQRWSATHPLPNAQAPVQPAAGTRPEFTPLERHYRIDINTVPPAIEESQWRLKIQGLVEQPLAMTLAEIRRYEPMHQFVTLSCISNPVGGDLIGTTRWTGVSLQRLLPDWRLKPGASHLKIRAADDFYEVVALDAIKADERVMLAYAWDGLPLTRDHGFPLRIYIPDIHGMKQPKWIASIEVLDHWEPGYWVKRGWDKVAQMKATAVIDAVAVDMTIIEADHRKVVPIGGIAHAGARGISKVEVQVDEGPWQAAALRTPLSELTWVVWRYDWPFTPGNHTFTVRCTDGKGAQQIATASPPEPNGASGLHNKTQMF
ncbi:MAG TPA: molybdopterin-dependent oxidoreductase [Candidatus Sulfotelmatobacter sp.]|nr:molybdopterin-dependent oxidoreductase [Candidatus Sulfotelmatobacter sp.]